MLTHIRCDVGVGILGHIPEGLYDVLRLDHLILARIVFQAVALAPDLDGLPPGAQCLTVGLGRALPNHRDHLGQHFLDIANNRDINPDALGNTRRINVNMDDLAFILGKVLGIADHAVIKTCAHRQQDIAVLHRVIGFHRTVHAQHAQKLAVARRISAQAHQRIGAGITQHIDQRTHLRRGVAQDDTATGVNIGTLGRQQELQRLADLSPMALANRVIGTHFHTFRIA